MANYFYDPNPATKEPKLPKLQKETVPYYLQRLDKAVSENGGYFVGGQVSFAKETNAIIFTCINLLNKSESSINKLILFQLTWADLYFIAISDYLQKMAQLDFFNDYPNLQALKSKVVNIPQIKNWIAKRPADE